MCLFFAPDIGPQSSSIERGISPRLFTVGGSPALIHGGSLERSVVPGPLEAKPCFLQLQQVPLLPGPLWTLMVL